VTNGKFKISWHLLHEIHAQYANYQRAHNKVPNTVYLNEKNIDILKRDHYHQIEVSNKDLNLKIFNMDIVPVWMNDDYIAVGFMEVANLGHKDTRQS
jgi:hypothetical protein